MISHKELSKWILNELEPANKIEEMNPHFQHGFEDCVKQVLEHIEEMALKENVKRKVRKEFKK